MLMSLPHTCPRPYNYDKQFWRTSPALPILVTTPVPTLEQRQRQLLPRQQLPPHIPLKLECLTVSAGYAVPHGPFQSPGTASVLTAQGRFRWTLSTMLMSLPQTCPRPYNYDKQFWRSPALPILVTTPVPTLEQRQRQLLLRQQLPPHIPLKLECLTVSAGYAVPHGPFQSPGTGSVLTAQGRFRWTLSTVLMSLPQTCPRPYNYKQ